MKAHDPQLSMLHELDEQYLSSPDGRDDLNLLEILLGVVQSSRSKAKGDDVVRTPWTPGERPYDIEITSTSLKIEWRAQIQLPDGTTEFREFYRAVECNRGLPGPHVEDVLVALLKLTAEHHFEEKKLNLTCHQLLELMQWNTTGYYYQRLRDVLHQLVGMSIHTNAIYNPSKGKYVERAFNILSDMEIDEDGRLSDADCYVRWATGIFELFQWNYTKPLDTHFFYSLNDPMTKRIYRWLDKHLRRASFIEVDVLEFAQKILGYGLSYKYPSQVKRKLRPKLDDLHSRGFVRHEIHKDPQMPSGAKYVFYRVSPYTSVLYPTRDNIIEALTERQVYDQVANELVEAYGWERCLRQIEHLDYKRDTDDEPKDHGAWLRSAIVFNNGKGYKLPEELRMLMDKARKETQRWCTEIYEAMPEKERDELRRTIFNSATPEQLNILRSNTDTGQDLLKQLINRHLLTRRRMGTST